MKRRMSFLMPLFLNPDLNYYYPMKTADITSRYESRVSLDVDVTTGKANVRLSSITLEDNKNFECRVTVLGDDEGTPAATTRLVVKQREAENETDLISRILQILF